jgi:hypothetical protein
MTMSADVEAADYMAFALPFKDGVAAAPESGLRQGEENEPFGETMSLRSLGASGAVLPAGFREQLKKAAEDEAARQASIQRVAAFRDDEERTALHAYELPSASPLPFESAPSSDEAPGLAESGSEPTMRMSVGKLPRPESGNEPPPSLPSHLASMTVEQYAALCAECAVHAEWADQISAGRYNVRDRAERELLDRVFRARMAADPQVAETWRTTYARVEQWAKQQRESRG